MAQHDYVIANGSGAAVRSDLNNALAAIVTNNSGSTEPATMYAYQFWADTTAGLLKLRNSANNAWITLRELDGTLTIEDGTVSAPGLAFASDLDTGFYRPGANQLAISTNAVERVEWGANEVVFNDPGNNYDFRVEGDTNANLLFIDASADAVGIGTDSPNERLSVNVHGTANRAVELYNSDTTLSDGEVVHAIRFTQNDDAAPNTTHASIETVTTGSLGLLNLVFKARDNSEYMRIDTSGRVGIGTGSPADILHLSNAGNLYLRVANTSTGINAYFGQDSNGTYIGNTGSAAVRFIQGASERMRLDTSGRLGIGTTSPATQFSVQNASTSLGIETDTTSGFGSGPTIRGFNRAGVAYTTLGLTGSQVVFGINDVEKARLDGSGRFLVGTSSAGDTSTAIFQGNNFSSTGGAIIRAALGSASPGPTAVLGELAFSDNTHKAAATIKGLRDGGSWSSSSLPSALTFSTTADSASSPTERMRIAQDGRVTTRGGGTGATIAFNVTNSADTALFNVRNDGLIGTGTSTNSPFNLTTASAANMFVASDGLVYRSTSSLKYKKNVADASFGLQELLSLRAVTYQSKTENDGETVYAGLIAEEVDAAGLQEFVQYADDGTPDALAYGNMVALCIKAIQEQQAVIADLQAKVAALEAQ